MKINYHSSIPITSNTFWKKILNQDFFFSNKNTQQDAEKAVKVTDQAQQLSCIYPSLCHDSATVQRKSNLWQLSCISWKPHEFPANFFMWALPFQAISELIKCSCREEWARNFLKALQEDHAWKPRLVLPCFCLGAAFPGCISKRFLVLQLSWQQFSQLCKVPSYPVRTGLSLFRSHVPTWCFSGTDVPADPTLQHSTYFTAPFWNN